MIFSENRFPLFRIMLSWDLGPRTAALGENRPRQEAGRFKGRGGNFGAYFGRAPIQVWIADHVVDPIANEFSQIIEKCCFFNVLGGG